jgi:hypothetical protein
MFKFLKITATVSLCSALMMIAPASEAALVNYTFNGVADSGSLIGETYNGSFAYDNLTLTNSGAESINLSSLTFNFYSSVFNLSNADVLTSSTADFFDGVFLGLSYTVNAFDPSFSFISGNSDISEAYFGYTTLSGDSGFGSLSYVADVSAVPVPGAFWLFGSGLGLLSFTRRKNQK